MIANHSVISNNDVNDIYGNVDPSNLLGILFSMDMIASMMKNQPESYSIGNLKMLRSKSNPFDCLYY